jgi:hypothetical protein
MPGVAAALSRRRFDANAIVARRNYDGRDDRRVSYLIVCEELVDTCRDIGEER